MGSIQERTDHYKQTIAGMDIFDTALWWAPQNVDTFVPYTDWKAQVEAWRAFGMKGGLVTTQTSAKYDAALGNDEAVRLIQGCDDIYACVVLTPEMFWDARAGRQYVEDLRKKGAVAARIFPGEYLHSTREYAIGPMLDVLEALNMPLLVWHIDTGWDAMDRICADHPKLKLVVESRDRKLLYHMRDYVSLMRRHENFYVETHNLVLFREYENICGLVGDERLLYGSFFPYMNADFSLYPIYAAEIPEASKRKIFAQNARRIFGV